MTLAESFRKNLSELLERGDHGQKALLAARSGFARTTVDFWLKRKRVPDLNQVEAVAKALGKRPQELLFEKSDPSLAWTEIIRRVGPIDDSQVPPILAGIRAALAGLALDQEEKLSQNSGDLTHARKRKT